MADISQINSMQTIHAIIIIMTIACCCYMAMKIYSLNLLKIQNNEKIDFQLKIINNQRKMAGYFMHELEKKFGKEEIRNLHIKVSDTDKYAKNIDMSYKSNNTNNNSSHITVHVNSESWTTKDD